MQFESDVSLPSLTGSTLVVSCVSVGNVIINIIKGWVRKNKLALTDSGRYLWKKQEFKIVEEVWPPPKNEN